MTIVQPKMFCVASLTLLLAISCAPQPKTVPPFSGPSATTVPVKANGPAKRRVKPSAIAASIEAAAKGAVTPGVGKMIDRKEQKLRATLMKAKDVEVSRQKALLTVSLRGEAGFASNSAAVEQGLYAAIERVATILDKHPRDVVRIEGHTDSQGSEAHNLDLSRRRAEAVKNLLAQLGIDPSRIEVAGLGESQPVAANADEAGRRMNRRIEIKIVPMLIITDQ